MKNLETNSITCLVCRKKIMDNEWFCRLPQKPDGTPEIWLCSPPCAMRHFGDAQTNGNNGEPDYDGFGKTKIKKIKQ